MLRIRNISVPVEHDRNMLLYLAARELKITAAQISTLSVARRSLDARKKDDVHYVYTVDVTTKQSENRVLKQCRNKNVSPFSPYVYRLPRPAAQPAHRPVVVGFGPAGMFAALALALAGLRPIVLERGCDAQTRRQKVEEFWNGGTLDPECNVQFGEGGAGTFSDGKLNTGTKNERAGWVLEQFVQAGACEDILYDAKPHVGTDVLFTVVQNLRARILSLGGEVRFQSRLTGIGVENGSLHSVEFTTPAGTERLRCSRLILAIGHSARDTFSMLHSMGVPMEPKPFSMGVRIEHPQLMVDKAQYGETRRGLPPADYKLSVHLPDGGSAYTFCMCPGGYVVAAASEPGRVVTNGMSNRARDGENANSALLVTLQPADFPDSSPLGGMYWQQQIEAAAFAAGGSNYHAPAQLVGDFLAHKPSTGARGVRPTYCPGVTYGDLHEVLPKKLTDVLEKALPALGQRLAGFDAPEAVMTAPETRSSSPVRILRGENRQSSLSGLFPCGEGAGYAGGIMSAAVDGLLCAEALIENL